MAAVSNSTDAGAQAPPRARSSGLTLRWKLMAAFGVVVALTGVLGGVAIYETNQLGSNNDTTFSEGVDGTLALGTIQREIQVYRSNIAIQLMLALLPEAARAQLDAQTEGEGTSSDRILETLGESDTQVLAALDSLAAATTSEQILGQVATLRTDWIAYTTGVVENMVPSFQSKDVVGSLTYALETEEPQYNALTALSLQTAEDIRADMASLRNDAASAQDTSRLIIMGLAGAVAVLGLAIAFFLSRGISGSATKVRDASRALAENDLPSFNAALAAMAAGDLTRRVSLRVKPIDVQSGDEMGEMAASFNAMLASLESAAQEYDRAASQISTLIEEVASAAQQVTGTSGSVRGAATTSVETTVEIARTIEEVARGATDQTAAVADANTRLDALMQVMGEVAEAAALNATSVNTATTTLSQMNRVIEDVADSAQTVSAHSATAFESARVGATAVNKTVDGMAAIRNAVEQTAVRVRELGEYSSKIGDIVAVIDDIAEQTNLLALNAAIEAARAGEHGRGFAVVADEVRKLAERSGEATKEIGKLISTVQSGTTEAVKAMESGVADVEAGTSQAAEAGDALGAILQSVEDTNNQVQQIAAAAQQLTASSTEMVRVVEGIAEIAGTNRASAERMSTESGEVSRGVQAIAAVSEENSASAEEVAASAETMRRQISSVEEAARELEQLASGLTSAIGRFRTGGSSAASDHAPVGWDAAARDSLHRAA